jgi:hypothetical protein
MAVCPKCRYEYEPHVRLCADCGSALVAPEDLPPADPVDPGREPQRIVSAFRAADEPSLHRVRSTLEAEGVKAVVRSFEVPWYDDVFKHPSGAWGEVLVLEQDAEKAREIIEVIETGRIVQEDTPEGEEQP